MATAAISKSVTKGEDLVVISRKEYEALLRAKAGDVLQSSAVVKHPEIESRLREAEEDIKAGRVSRTFTSVKELMADLNAERAKGKKAKKTA